MIDYKKRWMDANALLQGEDPAKLPATYNGWQLETYVGQGTQNSSGQKCQVFGYYLVKGKRKVKVPYSARGPYLVMGIPDFAEKAKDFKRRAIELANHLDA